MLPRLGLHHLALLAAIAEAGGLSAAAQRLAITQSAASHRLREAERRTGVPLVRRSPSGVTLTPEGERLRAYADTALPALARLEQDLAATARGRTLVRLGQATYSRYHWLPGFLDHLAATDPELTLDLAGAATARPLASLLDGQVDVSTIYGRPATTRRFSWTRLGTDPFVMVMAPDHPLAAEPHVDSTTLGDAQLYVYPFATEPGFEWESLLGRPTVPFRRLTEMPTPESVIDLIRAGFGVSPFSRWAIEPELAAGALEARPTGPGAGMALDWWAVTRAEDGPDSPAGRLVAALVSHAGRHGTGFERLAFDTPRLSLDDRDKGP